MLGLGALMKVCVCVHCALWTVVVFGSNFANLGPCVRGTSMNADVENGALDFCNRYWAIVVRRWGEGAEMSSV